MLLLAVETYDQCCCQGPEVRGQGQKQGLKQRWSSAFRMQIYSI